MPTEDTLAALEGAGLWFGPRAPLEENESFRQIIPYLLIRVDGKLVGYTRAPSGGESRLHGMVSVGLGGHVDIPDAQTRSDERFDLLATLNFASFRELQEELGAVGQITKTEWVGMLADIETEMAARHRAAVISEDLTVEAVDRDSPQYKGRAMNRLINDGAKGRYARAADGKAAWAGVPTLRVHSAYTSSTDVRNGVVDRTQRRGDVFTARADGAVAHADLNAALTIGLWPAGSSTKRIGANGWPKLSLLTNTVGKTVRHRPLMSRLGRRAKRRKPTCVVSRENTNTSRGAGCVGPMRRARSPIGRSKRPSKSPRR